MKIESPSPSLVPVMTTTAPRPTTGPARPLADLLAADAGLALAPAGPARAASGPEAVARLAAVAVRGVTHDSRAVRPGDIYAALPGARAHGAQFAADAVRAGAVAILTDPAGATAVAAAVAAAGTAEVGPATGVAALAAVPVLVTADPRARLGGVAAWTYGDPSSALRLLGVTGTNGKTTVAYMLEAGLRAAGHTTGLLGTVETRVAGVTIPAVRTTPEATDLEALLAVMVERGVTAAAMEVSSHALALHRVDGVHFAGAAFTNLSQDHLDFHPTMEDYFAAKASLFAPGRAGVAVVNVADRYGARLAAATPGALTYAVNGAADWRATDLDCGPTGTTLRVAGPGGLRGALRVRLPGAFNVANALAAVALLVATGTPLEAALAGISGLAGVPGRMEPVDAGQLFLALVDYAHTPDAVATLLSTVRPLVAPGARVIVVLGCGGDRDRGKRPLMGAAAAAGADLVIMTSDNPRSEDPEEIIAAMAKGARTVPAGGRARIVREVDRAAAIATAVAAARPGDAVIVAGKGHETGQEAGGVVTPFDDRTVLRAALVGALGIGAGGIGAGAPAGPPVRSARP